MARDRRAPIVSCVLMCARRRRRSWILPRGSGPNCGTLALHAFFLPPAESIEAIRGPRAKRAGRDSIHEAKKHNGPARGPYLRQGRHSPTSPWSSWEGRTRAGPGSHSSNIFDRPHGVNHRSCPDGLPRFGCDGRPASEECPRRSASRATSITGVGSLCALSALHHSPQFSAQITGDGGHNRAQQRERQQRSCRTVLPPPAPPEVYPIAHGG